MKILGGGEIWALGGYPSPRPNIDHNFTKIIA